MTDSNSERANAPAGAGTSLPEWDMTAFFPGLESAEFEAARVALGVRIQAAASLWDQHSVGRRADASTLSPAEVSAFEQVTEALNAVQQEFREVAGYVALFVSTDAANELAQSLYSELRLLGVDLDRLGTRWTAWVGTMPMEELLRKSALASNHRYALQQAVVRAAHQMSPAEEELASALTPTGVAGWARLHGDVAALLTEPVQIDGESRSLPISAIRALANDPDRAVRKHAYEAEIRAWERVAIPMAAALNGVKGFQRVLRDRRGYQDDIEPTLLSNSIDRTTLQAMQAACVEHFPHFRRYLRAKARALGLPILAWYDIQAPVGPEARTYSWTEAEQYVTDRFREYSDRLADFAATAFARRWVDVGPRAGKQSGAFCAGMTPGVSRILMNYDGSFNSVSTLAHELGHAYHNLCLQERTPLQRRTASTLAETASIFCETLVFEAAISAAPPTMRLSLLEVALENSLQVVVDIHSRFLFEQSVFARRGAKELSPREFCQLMVEAQKQTYGDAVDPETLHPYMWAVKGHYYGPTFYNYPYTFGLLFGLGLFEQYRTDPERFKAVYDDLLSSTGLDDAATLAARFGIDTRSKEFWTSSLDGIRRSIDTFELLVDQMTGPAA